MSLVPIISSAALVVLIAAAAVHLNTMTRQTAHCERFGFVLLFAGALTSVCEWWWPGVEDFYGETMLHVGLALIAVSMVRPQLREWRARMTGRWNGVNRRVLMRSAKADKLTKVWRP